MQQTSDAAAAAAPAEPTVELLIDDISALHEASLMTIRGIEAAKARSVRAILYETLPDVSADGNACTFAVKEVPVELSGAELVGSWRGAVELIEVPDLFNTNVLYTAGTYADLVRLDSTMFKEAAKYGMFEERNKRAIAALAKFKTNFENVQAALEEVVAHCEDAESKAGQIREELAVANAALRRAAALGAMFVPSAVAKLDLTPAQLRVLKDWSGAGSQRLGDVLYDSGGGTPNFAALQSACAGKTQLLFVLRSGANIFGGFLSTAAANFNGSWCGGDGTQFLFHLVNPYGDAPTKYAITNNTHAFYGALSSFVAFGNGHDLTFNTSFTGSCKLGHNYANTLNRGQATFTASSSGWTVQRATVIQVRR